MKTINDLYNEIKQNEELKNQFAEAAKNGAVVEFAKANGVETTLDEIKEFFEQKGSAEGELSDEEAANAAGGCNKDTWNDVAEYTALFY